MRILTTQIRANSGEAYVFGYNVNTQAKNIRRLVSYVPQEMSVWTDITGYENLLIYSKLYAIPSVDRKRIIENALSEMDLTEHSDRIVKTLSGGMIRRLEIACALLTKPKIMFLDEATIGLDPQARKNVWEKIKQFKNEYGVTVFLNTHYMDEADNYTDEVSIINKGRVVLTGVPENLKHSIGKESINLSLKLPLDTTEVPSSVLSDLRNIVHISEVKINNNSELDIYTSNLDETMPAIFTILQKNNLALQRISTNKPTLDDVFLKYAGTKFEPKVAEKGQKISEVKGVRSRIVKG
jgi:ABC-2 type transport system ATP-binding protein